MGGKSVTSVSVDEELHEQLRQDEHVNASGLFNKFLREYYSTGAVDGVNFRLRRVERELEKSRDRVKRLEEERDELRQLKEEKEAEKRENIGEVLDTLLTIDEEMLTSENPAVVTKAADLDISPEELAERARREKGRAGIELSYRQR